MPVSTAKQRLFFAEYEKDQNGRLAAIRAGYSPKSAHVTASRLLKRAKDEPEQAKALAKVRADVAARVEAQVEAAKDSAAWVLAKAIEIAEYGTAMTPVIGMFGPITGEDGKYVTEMRDPKVATTALALLAKRYPEFSEKHEIEAKVGVLLVRQTRGLRK